ncbi:MAG: VIT1/CCC1 transporter family protein [Mycobacteriales bacterium]|nr:VIT1/CCC1 transporter family protein [Frankia sp.]
MTATTHEPQGRLVDKHVHHRDIQGGWLRPAVFGAMDGLVSNVSLVSGVAGADAPSRFVLLAGLAGLVAGSFSMAVGEYNSVRSQQELALAELELERREITRAPKAEEAELAEMYAARGLSRDLAKAVAKEFSRDPDVAWRVHAREELGVDPDQLPSPWTAGIASFVSFACGAVVPLLPYLFGMRSGALLLACALSGFALFGVGALVSRFTNRSWIYAGMRQLVLGACAAIITYAVGAVIGVGAGTA